MSRLEVLIKDILAYLVLNWSSSGCTLPSPKDGYYVTLMTNTDVNNGCRRRLPKKVSDILFKLFS